MNEKSGETKTNWLVKNGPRIMMIIMVVSLLLNCVVAMGLIYMAGRLAK
jgi:hypothetical protein